MKLTALKPGKSGVIRDFTNLNLSVKLMEMGCLPGEVVTFERVAPLGDPIAISVAGYQLSLRKEEAATIVVEELHHTI
ncbi:ferrous iron transport protein A [Olivibacter sp. SDN3]|uniref:FeoA family protein n=1 Tax=Olivibacter sp. SDN3 TaxID=2764720 RepID=UPI001650E1CF|nr:ferrous iron transport protein A [Olivibacter sp. SDN3]QNL52112.1 ferrous iron transport protein A [Olivibacter sp. SDN3]